MNTIHEAKSNELMTEFTRYLIEHPDFADRIPEGAQAVLLDRQDAVYSQQAIKFSRNARKTDDIPERPVIYIEVTEMAPIRSRLQKLRVVETPPNYSVA